MSGHSKWHSIRHKKAATDAAKGKVFTRHAKIIAVAAKNGGDPDMNPLLRLAIENSKKDNMPNANIERAIKKGTGQDKNASEIMELTYEGYGPGGVAIIVEALTDNKNRSIANIKHIFAKNGGNLGEKGSVSWMFGRKGVITVKIKEEQKEDMELRIIEVGAEDIIMEEDSWQVITKPEEFHQVKEKIETEGNIEILNAELDYVPNNTVSVDDEATAKKIINLLQALEEDEDVSSLAANYDISDELMQKQ